MDKKVSVVSACYNGENYISRFLESILNQTFSEIQLIVVDDGSTDNTLSILNGYATKFAEKGIEYIILAQENGGQAKALNTGFVYANGEYITWPDTDDFLYDDSLMQRVRFLEEHPEFGMVLSNGDEYTEDGKEKIYSCVVEKKQADNLLDCVLDMTAMFNNNGYLVRSEILWSVYPEKKIYENRAGQNIQILLPLGVACKCGYLSTSLYGRTIRTDSHSKQQKDFKNRTSQINDIYYHTITALNKRQSYVAARYALHDLYLQATYAIAKGTKREEFAELRTIKKLAIKYYIKLIFHLMKARLWRKQK